MDLATHGNQGHHQYNSSHGQNVYQQGPSQAKNTLQRYNGGGQDNNVRNKFANNNLRNIETRTHPSTVLQHTYDKERYFLVDSQSDLAVAIILVRRTTGSLGIAQWPKTIILISLGFSEILMYKPHTKRPEFKQLRQTHMARAITFIRTRTITLTFTQTITLTLTRTLTLTKI